MAAKARVRRMIAFKPKRKDLAAPDYLANHWNSSPRAKDELAQMLKDCNWNRAPHPNYVDSAYQDTRYQSHQVEPILYIYTYIQKSRCW